MFRPLKVLKTPPVLSLNKTTLFFRVPLGGVPYEPAKCLVCNHRKLAKILTWWQQIDFDCYGASACYILKPGSCLNQYLGRGQWVHARRKLDTVAVSECHVYGWP